jgi:DNA excision repair protein ERCC-2
VSVDHQTRSITVSVRDLCDPEAAGGSLNLSPLASVRSGMGRTVHAAHQTSQAAEFPSYRKEQPIRYTTRFREYSVAIHGRIDGVYETQNETILEEIKSVLSWGGGFEAAHVQASYVLQLKIYLYLWMQLHPEITVSGRLILISCEPEGTVALPVSPDTASVEALIAERLQQIVNAEEEACQRRSVKEAKAEAVPFPFPHFRKYQDRMIEAISDALQNQQSLLVSAPTGIGKTVAALYSTLRFAAGKGLSVFFLTSKTTQQRIVADTLRLWEREFSTEDDAAVPLFNSLILRSKEKSCANDVVFCHESRCRYAKDFFAKLEQSGVRDRLIQEPLITPERVYAAAVEEEVCPFELSLELLERVDLTVCDYNYVFDPRVAIHRLTDKDRSRTILVIDEAHNLYSRAREYYSPPLELVRIQELRRSINAILNPAERSRGVESESQAERPMAGPSRSFLARLEAFLGQLEDYFRATAEEYPEFQEAHRAEISIDRELFRQHREELDELMKLYLIHQRHSGHLQDEDRVLQFFYMLSDFCRVLELGGDEFVHVIEAEAQTVQIRILCLDPAPQLRKCHQQYYAVVGMSATLSPMAFYRDVLGFERDITLLALPSPFPPENRKILVVPEVSTTYGQREKNYPRIARIVEEVVAIRPGNYFAFFPSFDFLNEVSALLKLEHAEVLIQHRFMADHHRSALLDKLRETGKAHLVLAVQGGIFAEGVDYPGELAVGAIIVGPGLPKVSFELELMRRYYEQHYSKGFEYAYLYPGMNRVVQSAGRIVRSETDKGVIVLLDRRFSYENYSRLFPRDWYQSSPSELICRNYREELSGFWKYTQHTTRKAADLAKESTQTAPKDGKTPKNTGKTPRNLVDNGKRFR